MKETIDGKNVYFSIIIQDCKILSKVLGITQFSQRKSCLFD